MQNLTIPTVRPDHWLWGSAEAYLEESPEFLQQCAESYGEIFQLRLAHKKLVFVNKPDYVRHILHANQANYRRHYAYDVLKLIFGDSIITLDGDKWSAERKLTQPLFHKLQLRDYFPIISKVVSSHLESWNEQGDVKLRSEMGKLTLDVVSNCMLGSDIGKRSQIIQKHLPIAMGVVAERVFSPLQFPPWFPTRKNKQLKHSVGKIRELVDELIHERQKTHDGKDLISQYLSSDEHVSHKRISDAVLSLLAGGHETTTIALYVLLTRVLESPSLQQNISRELSEVTNGDPLGYEHLVKLKFMRGVIREALRLSTPAWSLGRQAIEDDVIDGYGIPAGSSVIVCPYIMHRNPDYWERPHDFWPERFEQPIKHKYAFIPFGGGPKSCVGLALAEMEMQIVLYRVLKTDFGLSKNNPKMDSVTFNAKSLVLKPDVEMILTSKQSLKHTASAVD